MKNSMKAKTADVSTRKGAVRMADIPPAVLRDLNAGLIEARSLVEWLAIDVRQLWQSCGLPAHKGVSEAFELGTQGRSRMMGKNLYETVGIEGPEFERLATHSSDMVRSWAGYAVGAAEMSFAERMKRMRRFANDPSMSTRESAWDSWRPHLIKDLPKNLKRLEKWTKDKDHPVRRCAIEGTRPRGVWTFHIHELRENPELALPLLEAVRSDESRYVQNAVGNWLNDAGKTQPKFVMKVTDRWLKESPTKETAYIVRRARRSF